MSATEKPPAPFTVSGPLKWFDVTRGFGFVATEGGDVFLHHDAFKASGIAICPPGTKVTCLARRTDRGLSAIQVVDVDMPRFPADGDGWVAGTIKTFQPDKGWGFVTCSALKCDVYFYAQSLKGTGMLDYRKDTPVLIRVGTNERGPIVTDMRPDTWREGK